MRTRPAVITVLTMGVATLARAQSYTVVDLGAVGGLVSHALAVDAQGNAVGYSTTNPVGDAYRATLWQNATPQSIGVLPGKTDSFASAINASLHVVGNASSAIYYNRGAFMWTPDRGMQDIGTLGGPGSQSAAEGINDSDVIVGWSTLMADPAPRHAFVYAAGIMTDLGPGTAYGISNNGAVVGDNGQHAVVWYGPDTVVELGTLGGNRSTARGINEWGWVVGGADEDPANPSDTHAFIWDPVNGMANLGTLGGASSIAHAMSGFVAVGESRTASGASHAMLYDANGPGYPFDLNDFIPADSGWVLTAAHGVNACGEIVGEGLLNGRVRGFLLVPEYRTDCSSDLVPATITFDGLSAGSPFTSYEEAGLTVSTVTGEWDVFGYGNPGPSVVFFRAATEPTITASLEVTAGGSPFAFTSVDLYSSVTPIPYTITGLRNGNVVFEISDTVPNTFGQFATVTNPNGDARVDTLVIQLSNPDTACCSNPVGIDNIVVRR